MRRTIAALGMTGLVLVCAGCVAPDISVTDSRGPQSSASPASASPSTSATENSPTDLPNEAQPVTPETEAELAIGSEEAYLAAVREAWQGGETPETTWIELGNNACSELEGGKPEPDIYVMADDSDASRSNNGLVVSQAHKNLCPQYG